MQLVESQTHFLAEHSGICLYLACEDRAVFSRLDLQAVDIDGSVHPLVACVH